MLLVIYAEVEVPEPSESNLQYSESYEESDEEWLSIDELEYQIQSALLALSLVTVPALPVPNGYGDHCKGAGVGCDLNNSTGCQGTHDDQGRRSRLWNGHGCQGFWHWRARRPMMRIYPSGKPVLRAQDQCRDLQG